MSNVRPQTQVDNIVAKLKELQAARVEASFKDPCFVTSTLIHTKEGLRPIEQIKVGDYVLSKPENGVGELSYKPVTRTFVHESDDLWLISFNYRIKDIEKIHLAAGVNEINGEKWYIGQDWIAVTGNHPFFTKDKGWIKAYDLGGKYSSGEKVELANGDYASASLFNRILQTETPNLGWAPRDLGFGHAENGGYSVELVAGELKVEGRSNAPELVLNDDGTAYRNITRTVYNFEVHDNHTYYVGESGLWAHNKGEIAA